MIIANDFFLQKLTIYQYQLYRYFLVAEAYNKDTKFFFHNKKTEAINSGFKKYFTRRQFSAC